MAEHQSVSSRLQRKLPPYLLACPGACHRLPADSSVSRQHRAAPSEKQVAKYGRDSLRSDEHSLGPSTMNQTLCGRSKAATESGTRLEHRRLSEGLGGAVPKRYSASSRSFQPAPSAIFTVP